MAVSRYRFFTHTAATCATSENNAGDWYRCCSELYRGKDHSLSIWHLENIASMIVKIVTSIMLLPSMKHS